jgi:hypothetical protein
MARPQLRHFLLAACGALALVTAGAASAHEGRGHWEHRDRGWRDDDGWRGDGWRGDWHRRDRVVIRDRVVVRERPVYVAPPVVYERPYYYPRLREPSIVIGVDVPPLVIPLR